MRSKRRFIFNAATLLCLFLYVTTIILWTRSYSGNKLGVGLNPVLPMNRSDGDAFHVLSKEKGTWLEANSYHGDLFFLRLSNFTVIDHGPNTDDPQGESTQAGFENLNVPATRFVFQWRNNSDHMDVREDERTILWSVPLPQAAYSRELSFKYFDMPLRHIALFQMWNHFGSPSVPRAPSPPEMLPRCQLLILPHYFFAILFAAVPLFRASHWLLTRQRRRSRKNKRLCQNCGYDLRATPNQCPECGIAPSKLGRGG